MRIYLIGVTGAGFSVHCTLLRQGVNIYGYLDDRIRENEYHELKYSGDISRDSIAESAKEQSSKFITAIGSEKNFYRRSQKLASLGIPEESNYNVISNQSILETSPQKVGSGVIVLDQAFVGYSVVLGNNVLINAMAYIGHESFIDNSTIIGPNVTIAGNVIIGKDCYLGAGSTVKNHIKICDQVLVGCGSVVVKDIIFPGIYVGNPARLLCTLEEFIARK